MCCRYFNLRGVTFDMKGGDILKYLKLNAMNVYTCCACGWWGAVQQWFQNFWKLSKNFLIITKKRMRFVLPLLLSSMSNSIIIINAYDNMLHCKTTSMGSKCHNTKDAIWEDNWLIDWQIKKQIVSLESLLCKLNWVQPG